MLDLKKLKENYEDICQLIEVKNQAQFLAAEGDSKPQSFENLISEECEKRPDCQRLLSEFLGYGPLEELFKDADVTEILINSPDGIWYEKHGKLQSHHDQFLSSNSHHNIVDRLVQKSRQHLTIERPYVESHYKNMRISVIGNSLTLKHPLVSIRKHPEKSWTLEKLFDSKWCERFEMETLIQLVNEKMNFLVIGETGSGKTSVVDALLQKTNVYERSILIEDSSELRLPNDLSVKLLTRMSLHEHLKEIDQQCLLQRALRLRPDRLIMGEIRGAEAKDFLLMLATGHSGCMATLHAKTPWEALARLEMLIQMGAPQWSLSTVRRLIFSGIQYVIVTKRMTGGERRLAGVYRVSSLEESGVTLESDERFTRSTTSSEMV